MQAESTRDLERVRSVLQRDAIATAYMLGDLDPVYAPYCTWWVALDRAHGHDVAVLQVYTGLSAPVVLTHGSTEGIAAIVRDFRNELPGRAHVHLDPEHLAVLKSYFQFERLRPMMRMGLRAAELASEVPAPGPDYEPIARLGHRDTGDIVALSAFYPDSFFEPHQLSSGHYYGIRTTGTRELVSVAGLHILSRTDGLAALGNIVTHPEHRGRGLSTACTAHLSAALRDEGVPLLVLNVQHDNTHARRIYEKLGFREHATYLEGFLVRALESNGAAA
ncbi:MAG: GNAT family N-acetyltransferase [Deltaproteobacteria bacterium]|nr:GNAT family N-acetyltransferase [Deltaproteobacteria bacterium]